MFSVKATYCGETRKFSFPESNSFPSFVELYNQLYRVFPHLGYSFTLSLILFSPDSSESRILLAKEARNAEQYKRAISNPSLAGPWPNPMLKFTVLDDTPAKGAIELPTAPQTPWGVSWSTPPGLEPLSHIDLPASNPYTPNPPVPFSMGAIPPPPVLFSQAKARPWATPPFQQQQQSPFPSFPYSSPQQSQMPNRSPCCAVAEAKQDVRVVIEEFKTDLDRILVGLAAKETSQSDSLPNNSFNSQSCVLHDCADCRQVFSGPWVSCNICNTVLCRSCKLSSSSYCKHTLARVHHDWSEHKCAGCPSESFRMQPFAVPTPFTYAGMQPPIGSPPAVSGDPPVIPRMHGYTDMPGGLWPPPASWAVSPESTAPAAPKVIHTGVTCDACDTTVEGIRHKCMDCPDYDLCSKCINQGAAERHDPFHEFIDINEPGKVVVHLVDERHSGNFSRNPAPEPAPIPVPAPTAPSANVVHSANCDLCDSRIRGDRYKCINCPDFDTCSSCFAITSEQHPRHTFVKVTSPDAIFPRAFVGKPQHHASCNVCNRTITGVRFKCMHPTCPDFDLCESCEAHPIRVHPDIHPLLKMRSPETVVPTVYRVGTTTLIDVEERGRPSTRLSTPLSHKSPSRSHSPEPLPWFYESRAKEPQSIPGQFPFALRTPSPRPARLSPPPLPPKAFEPEHYSPLESWTARGQSATTYNPAYITRSPSPTLSYASYSSPAPPSKTAYKPVYLGNGAMLPPPPPPPPAPEVTSFYRHDWLVPSSNASPNFDDLYSPLPVTDDLVERAIVQYPSVVPNSSWTQSLQRKLSVDMSEDNDLVLPEAPKFVPAARSALLPIPRAVPPPPPPQKVVPSWADWQPDPNCVPTPPSEYRSPVEESQRSLFGMFKNTVSSPWPPTPPRPDFSRDISELASLMMQPPQQSPVQEETFLTPVSDTTQLPIPERDSPTSTSYRTHSLAELLNEFPPRSHFSVSDVSRANPSSISSRILDTPIVEQTPEVEVASSMGEDVVKSWRSEVELPFSAGFLEDVTVSDGQVFPPGAEFVKAWKVKNTGRDWDATTELLFVAGESFSADKAVVAIPVGEVKRGEEVDLWTGELKAPDAPGRYVGYWRLKNSACHLFGASIWIDITVAEHNSPESTAPSSMSSSSVIVMPAPPATSEFADMVQAMQQRAIDSLANMSEHRGNMSTTAAVTAASGSSGSDVISLDGSEDSFSGASLVSAPSSDDWEDGRVNVVTAPASAAAPTTATPSNASAPRSNALDYVVLYDDNSSSEEGF